MKLLNPAAEYFDTIALEVIIMQDNTLKRNIESAGGWFVGEYTALILSKFNELENDKDFKNEFVRGREEIRIMAVLELELTL